MEPQVKAAWIIGSATVVAAAIALAARRSRAAGPSEVKRRRTLKDDLALSFWERLTFWRKPLHGEPQDVIAQLRSWMGNRPAAFNTRVIRYSAVDRKLRLAPGSAKKHLEQAAARWGYVVDTRGVDSILFKEAPHEPRRSRWMDGVW